MQVIRLTPTHDYLRAKPQPISRLSKGERYSCVLAWLLLILMLSSLIGCATQSAQPMPKPRLPEEFRRIPPPLPPLPEAGLPDWRLRAGLRKLENYIEPAGKRLLVSTSGGTI